MVISFFGVSGEVQDRALNSAGDDVSPVQG